MPICSTVLYMFYCTLLNVKLLIARQCACVPYVLTSVISVCMEFYGTSLRNGPNWSVCFTHPLSHQIVYCICVLHWSLILTLQYTKLICSEMYCEVVSVSKTIPICCAHTRGLLYWLRCSSPHNSAAAACVSVHMRCYNQYVYRGMYWNRNYHESCFPPSFFTILKKDGGN